MSWFSAGMFLEAGKNITEKTPEEWTVFGKFLVLGGMLYDCLSCY